MDVYLPANSSVTLVLMSAWFLLLPAQSFAQTLGPIPELAIEVSPQFSYEKESQAFYSQVFYSKVASSAELAPEFKSAGSVQTIFFSFGVRTKDFSNYGFRWRAGLLNMDLIRTPISMGITLIDYNQSGLMDLDVRWINLRLGPSLYIGSDRNYLTLKTIGSAGLTSSKLGTFAYTGLSSSDGLSLRKRSYEVGYTGEILFFFANSIALSSSFSYRHLLGGVRPEFYKLKATLGIKVTDGLSFQGSYSIEAAKSNPSSVDSFFIDFGIGLLL